MFKSGLSEILGPIYEDVENKKSPDKCISGDFYEEIGYFRQSVRNTVSAVAACAP